MKNKIVLILVLVINGYTTNAQVNFQWAKGIGGTFDDAGNAIATDASGNVYTVGVFNDTVDFDPGVGVYNMISLAGNGFISKMDAAGNFIWAKALGGEVKSLCLDASGNLCLSGTFYGTVDFDPSAGIFNLTSMGSNDIYVAKYNSSGALIWAKAMGGIGGDVGYSIVSDAVGNTFTTGTYSDTVDFNPGIGTYDIISDSLSYDIFVLKLDASGNFVWAKSMGGSGTELAYSIAIDASGNLYTAGNFSSFLGDFDPGVGTYNLSTSGSLDIVINKLDASGNFVWAKKIGGTGLDRGRGITIDGLGSVCFTGGFANTVDMDPGTGVFNISAFGTYDSYVVKLDTSGNFIWAKSVGGTAAFSESGYSITVDGFDNIYFVGNFGGSGDFDPGSGVYTLTSAGSFDFYICKLDASGTFIWAQSFGGINNDNCYSIAEDGTGNIYTTGVFQGVSDFDGSASVNNLTSNGNNDIYVLKLHNSNVGINEQNASQNESINAVVYPNPGNGIITLSANLLSDKSLQMNVMDVTGKIVHSFNEQKISAGNNSVQLDVSDLSNGIYFIKVFDKSVSQTVKMIISK